MRGGLRREEQTDTEKKASSTENRTRRGWKDETARKKMEPREGHGRVGGAKGRGRQKRKDLKRLLEKPRKTQDSGEKPAVPEETPTSVR